MHLITQVALSTLVLSTAASAYGHYLGPIEDMGHETHEAAHSNHDMAFGLADHATYLLHRDAEPEAFPDPSMGRSFGGRPGGGSPRGGAVPVRKIRRDADPEAFPDPSMGRSFGGRPGSSRGGAVRRDADPEAFPDPSMGRSFGGRPGSSRGGAVRRDADPEAFPNPSMGRSFGGRAPPRGRPAPREAEPEAWFDFEDISDL